MVVRKYPNIFTLFFVYQGSIVNDIKYKLVFFFAISYAVSALELSGLPVSLSVFTMLGLSLSLFLSFRNNTAYNRWWEGRNVWGKLVEDTRSLARTSRMFVTDEALQYRIDSLIIAYPVALRHQCQGTKMDADIQSHLGDVDCEYVLNSINPANRILSQLSCLFSHLHKAGNINEAGLLLLEHKISSMALTLAACERLNNTPIPYAYTLILQRTAFLYCGLLPFAMVGQTGWATPILIVIIAYTFFGFDALARDLEDPFTHKPNGLPLNMMCVAMERVLKDMQGIPVADLPQLPPVVNYVLK